MNSIKELKFYNGIYNQEIKLSSIYKLDLKFRYELPEINQMNIIAIFDITLYNNDIPYYIVEIKSNGIYNESNYTIDYETYQNFPDIKYNLDVQISEGLLDLIQRGFSLIDSNSVFYSYSSKLFEHFHILYETDESHTINIYYDIPPRNIFYSKKCKTNMEANFNISINKNYFKCYKVNLTFNGYYAKNSEFNITDTKINVIKEHFKITTEIIESIGKELDKCENKLIFNTFKDSILNYFLSVCDEISINTFDIKEQIVYNFTLDLDLDEHNIGYDLAKLSDFTENITDNKIINILYSIIFIKNKQIIFSLNLEITGCYYKSNGFVEYKSKRKPNILLSNVKLNYKLIKKIFNIYSELDWGKRKFFEPVYDYLHLKYQNYY